METEDVVFSSENNKSFLTKGNQQYWVRLIISLFLFVVLFWQDGSSFHLAVNSPILLIITGYALLNVTIIFLTRQGALREKQVKYLSITSDTAGISLLLFFGDKSTSAVCFAYYLLTIHNGIGAKNRELLISTLLSVLCFSAILYLSSYWSSQSTLGIGLIVGLLFISAILYKNNNDSHSNRMIRSIDKYSDEDIQKSLQVLVVTNDLKDRHMLLSYIDSWGIHLDTYNSSLRALTELVNRAEKGDRYTTVIVDSLNMDMSPMQFAKHVQSDSVLSNIHLIHLSPELSTERGEQLLNAGYTTLLKTPIDKTILFDALHSRKTLATNSKNITQLIRHYSGKTNNRKPLDILLAVYNKEEQDSFRATLERNGQRVYTVNNGSQTHDALNTHQFDLVVLDFNMPDIEGKEIIRLYYYTYLNEDWAPFIALVDEATPEVLSQCREAEVNAILVRPVGEEELLITVADIASSKTKQAESIDKHGQPSHVHEIQIKDCDDQILNTQTLKQLVDLSSSKNFLDQLTIRFTQDMNVLMDGLECSINENRFTDFKDLAYALKDSSCNLGASYLHKLSLQALQINQQGFQRQARLLFNDLQETLTETKYALQNYANNQDDSASKQE